MPNPPDDPLIQRRRLMLFGLLAVAVTVGVVAYALYSQKSRAPVPTARQFDGPIRVAEVRREAHLLFRHTGQGPAYGRVAMVGLKEPDGERVTTPLSCDRVYATEGSGLCLQASRGVFTTYRAVSFDKDFREQHSFGLPGAPSRTRVSPDGRRAASTVFVSGDSYASGGFSTRTAILDLESKAVVGDLEAFGVTLDGKPFKNQDFNFWGVTFLDADRFFATLSSRGVLYLVEGRISERSIRVLRTGVECPSLSPDGKRLAFKARVVDRGRLLWRLRVLDLTTTTEAVVSEIRSVDDQAEWLDNTRLLYALPGEEGRSSDVWVANADGSGAPSLFVRDAYSPSIVRPQEP